MCIMRLMSRLRRVTLLTALVLVLGTPVAWACDAWNSSMPECSMPEAAPSHCAPEVTLSDCCDMQSTPDTTFGTLLESPVVPRVESLAASWIRVAEADRVPDSSAATGLEGASDGACPSYRLFATLLL